MILNLHYITNFITEKSIERRTKSNQMNDIVYIIVFYIIVSIWFRTRLGFDYNFSKLFNIIFLNELYIFTSGDRTHNQSRLQAHFVGVRHDWPQSARPACATAGLEQINIVLTCKLITIRIINRTYVNNM